MKREDVLPIGEMSFFVMNKRGVDLFDSKSADYG